MTAALDEDNVILDDNSRKQVPIPTLQKWLTEAFEKRGLAPQSILKREQCWFIKDLGETPQGDECPPLPDSVFSTVSGAHAVNCLKVVDYVQEMAIVMNDLENKSKPFVRSKTENEKILENLKKMESAFANRAKISPAKVPPRSYISVKPRSITCPAEGSYTIYLQVGDRREIVVENLRVKQINTPSTIESSAKFAAEVGSVNDILTLELFNHETPVASGIASAFALFEDLTPANDSSELMFEPQTLRLSLEIPGSSAAIDVDLEMNYFLTLELFNVLLMETKKQPEAVVKKLKTDLQVYGAKINDVLQAFGQIKFDYETFCFYNESEEIREFAAKKGQKVAKRKNEAKLHRDNCADCCAIV